jgi:hypothetical protein
MLNHIQPSQIAVEFTKYLVVKHWEQFSNAPSALQADGYRKIGKQVEKFYIQFSTMRKMDRCRQILFSNIPQICQEHGLGNQSGIDPREVLDMVGGFCYTMSTEWFAYFHSVEQYHASSDPSSLRSPDKAGCLAFLLLAIPVTIAAAAMSRVLV